MADQAGREKRYIEPIIRKEGHEDMEQQKNKGEWLKGLGPRRRAAGYTQAAFAARIGIVRARYAMWESGNSWPSARWLPVMASVLGCGIEDLFQPFDDIVAETEATEQDA